VHDAEAFEGWSHERMEAWASETLDSPRMRKFPFLGGWAVVLFPLDRFSNRGLAWAYLRAMYELHDDELVDLRARRYPDEDGVMRIWWVTAITPAGMERRGRP
jgi:hypothetical protein